MELSKRCKDITGQTFGSITAIKPLHQNQSGEVIWECSCACGAYMEKSGAALRTMVKKYSNPLLPSCGCMIKESLRENAIKQFTKHGCAQASGQHPIYRVYHKMRGRCYNPQDTNYKRYGAKGVTICAEWLDHPEAFIEWCLSHGWQEGLQLDKDILCEQLGISPKVYSPSTCQFITQHTNLIQSASRSTYGKNENIKYSQEMVDGMIAMYEQGATKAAVSLHYGISRVHSSRLIPTTR